MRYEVHEDDNYVWVQNMTIPHEGKIFVHNPTVVVAFLPKETTQSNPIPHLSRWKMDKLKKIAKDYNEFSRKEQVV